MISVLALDIATTTGFCRGDVGGQPTAGSIRFGTPEISASVVFANALKWISEILEPQPGTPPPDILILEALLPASAKFGSTTKATHDRLAGLHGIIRAVASLKGVPQIAEASVGDIRAHFIGQRHLKSTTAKRAVLERCRMLGWIVKDTDAADACALWSYACAIVDPRLALRVVPMFNNRLRVAEYDPNADVSGSFEEAYRAIRERKAKGGKGWEPKS